MRETLAKYTHNPSNSALLIPEIFTHKFTINSECVSKSGTEYETI